MRHFLKMKLLLLMALLLAGYGSMRADAIPSAVVTTAEFGSKTYTWTDASGTSHTSPVLEKATDPYQIYELIRTVFIDKDFPGPYYRGYGSSQATMWNQSTNAVIYNWGQYGDAYETLNTGWGLGNAGDCKPTNCGSTVLLIEPKTADHNNWDSGYPRNKTKAAIVGYIDSWIKSAQVLADPVRVGTYANHTSGTLYNISGNYQRLYFISKGKLLSYVNLYTNRSFTSGMYEEIAPVSGTSVTQLSDYYAQMAMGGISRAIHDCPSVEDLNHFYQTDSASTERAFSGLSLFLPDYRMAWWNQRDQQGSEGSYNFYYYNQTYAPATFLYTVRLEGEAYDSIPNDNQYWVNLNWISSFDEVVGETVDQKYNLYVVNEDGSRTLVDENLTQDMLNQTNYGYWVAQGDSSYTITYVVSARPVGSDGEDIWTETWSNEVTVLIPGLNPDEKFTLKLVDYYSDFDVDNQRNKYINKLSLSEDIAYGLKAGNLREGANNFDFHRAGGGNDRVFARLTLTSTGSLNTDPSLSLSNPAAIVGEGSTTVTVRGWNLTPGSTVTVTASNGFTVSPTILTVGSDGSLNATVTVTADGTQASGTVTVSAATDDQTATANVTWSAQPQVTVAAPTFTPPAGNYQAAQSVTIASATSGATIYYSTTTALTADNYSTAGTVYSSAIAVGEGTTTIYAIAVLDGVCSTVSSATYVVTIPSATVATPVINPNGGTDLTSAQTVTITCATAGATIYYTTDGTTPSASNGTQYTGSFTVSADCTVKAIAVLNGTSSEVASATFTFTQASGDDVYTLVTNINDVNAQGEYLIVYRTSSTAPTGTAMAGTPSGSSYYRSGSAVTITDNTITLANGSTDVSRFTLESGSTSGTWRFYSNTNTTGYLTYYPSGSTYYLGTTTSPSTQADATVALTTDNFATIKLNSSYYLVYSSYSGFDLNSYSSSSSIQLFKKTSGGGGGTTEQVATPTFSPAAGTYSEAQNVTISCATSGATIYYTTDGTTPTTSSAQYGSAITVSSTMTVKAIAVKSGMTNSEVASALYTITPAAPTFSPDGGSFSSATDVTITGPTGSTINWTFTTTEGTATSGSGNSPVTVNISASGTLSATATVSGSTSNATTATYTVTQAGTDDVYTLVTSASDLTTDGEYLIVYQASTSATSGIAMADYRTKSSSTSYDIYLERLGESVTIDNSAKTITLPSSNTSVARISLSSTGYSAYPYYVHCDSPTPGYLYSNNGTLATYSDQMATERAGISIASTGVATFDFYTSSSSYENYLGYSTTNSKFVLYSTSGDCNVRLYKKTTSGGGGDGNSFSATLDAADYTAGNYALSVNAADAAEGWSATGTRMQTDGTLYIGSSGNITFTVPSSFSGSQLSVSITTANTNYGSGTFLINSNALTCATGSTQSLIVSVAAGGTITITGNGTYSPDFTKIEITSVASQSNAPRRRAAGAAAVQRAAASSITVTPTWTYVTNASENPEYLQIDASKTTTFTGTPQTYTDAETVISVMNMFASGSYFYDQFAASTAENNHPDSYTYYVRFAEAVGVTDVEGITSNDVTVPVYKANSKIGGSYTKAECDADTVHGYDVSDAIDASIQVQNKSEIYYYELSRRMNQSGATEVVGSYQRMPSSDYQDMITLQTYEMDPTAANLWIEKTDAAIQAGQEAFYVPRAVTLHIFGENVNGSAPGLNNYGGPITPAFLGSVEMALTHFYGAVNDANHTNPVDSAEWTYNGKRYCYYNVELAVNPDQVLEGKDRDDTYELYKYRVWRVLADGNYNEILASRKFREKGDYLFDEVNIREEQDVWPSAYNNRGDYPVWTTAGRTRNGVGLDDNGNGPEASGTFGGRLATSQAEALPVTFIARLYYRSKSVNNTQNSNKAPRMAGASDEGGNYYYIVEKRLPAEIYRDENHTAVDGVTVAKEVESVKFYNVAGMESDKPFEGVNIVVTRYTDGTTSSQKVLK